MKILIFHNAVAPYRIDFFNSLSKAFDTHICIFYRRFIQPNYIDSDYILSKLEFTPEYREDFRGLKALKSNNAVKQCIVKYTPDIVLTMEFGLTTMLAVFYRMFLRRKYRIVSMVDESYDMTVGRSQFTWRHNFARKILLPFVDDMIVVNNRVRDYYQYQCSKGILFPIITEDEKARQRQIEALSISTKHIEHYGLEGKKVILFVGRLIPIKNIGLIIETFNTINDPDRVFVIVGDGEERESLNRICNGRKDVIFTGALSGSELYAWYNIASIFVLPSFIEPFGAVVNEALQGGCLCLVSEVAGSCCLIEEGKNGYVLPPNNSQRWCDTITIALNRVESITKTPTVRESKMSTSFNKYMSNLIARLDSMAL